MAVTVKDETEVSAIFFFFAFKGSIRMRGGGGTESGSTFLWRTNAKKSLFRLRKKKVMQSENQSTWKIEA